ncbi:putative phage abortive infection protein [Desulfotalea psychrophila]|uniref:Phage abortive infection protein n=1 Tax=Desulfotalea psychrophila (strain LSv54 / DSM 12343) TaxID=177439 RepID=Q6AMY0_DESPS|nr:putative phage abortive infection protein [Desulfotalea psychrophila]CAG36294.1 hypothetical protein DP1565 [Desulfotalea psychrophila LSv54]
MKPTYTNDTKNHLPNFLTIIGIAGLLGLVVVPSTYFYHFQSGFSTAQADWSAFGDFVGGSLGPILSFFGLIAILLTLHFQAQQLKTSQTELALSREELTLTRKELAKSAVAQKCAADTAELQYQAIQKDNFEKTFFHLMSLYNDIVASLELISENKIVTRKKCFSEILRIMSFQIENRDCHRNHIIERYNTRYKEIESSLAHYHKTLYQILLFIETNAEGKNKKQYSNFIRSQLSTDEIHLLFFHGLSSYGSKKFKILIEKFEFFEHLPISSPNITCKMHLYKSIAYGQNEDCLAVRESFSQFYQSENPTQLKPEHQKILLGPIPSKLRKLIGAILICMRYEPIYSSEQIKKNSFYVRINNTPEETMTITVQGVVEQIICSG